MAKNSSGYDLKNIIVGSEGTLAIATEIILKLVPLPSHIISLLVPFETLEACIETVPKIIQSKIVPTAIEFMEREVIEAGREISGPHISGQNIRRVSLVNIRWQFSGRA